MNRIALWINDLLEHASRLWGILVLVIGLQLLRGCWAATLDGRWGWGEVPFLGWGLTVTTFAAGIALLTGRRRSREFGTLQMVLLAVALTWHTFAIRGYSHWRLLAIAATLWTAYSIWTEKDESSAGSDEEEDTSSYPVLILLRTTPMFVDSTVVARFATRAFGVPFSVMGDDSVDDPELEKGALRTVAGHAPEIYVGYGRLAFRVAVHDTPMEGYEGLVAELGPSALGEAISRHRARIGVVALQAPHDPSHSAELFSLCGKLLAEFYDDECVAVILGEDYSAYVAEPGMKRKLRSDDPAAALRSRRDDPIFHVSSDDPHMQEAFREARARWPEFVAEFERRAASDESLPPCFVKVPFDTEGAQEFMWLKVTALEGDSVFGILDNDPGMTSKVVQGDRIRKPLADVCDWLLLDGPKPRGGFTLAAMRKIQERRCEDGLPPTGEN